MDDRRFYRTVVSNSTKSLSLARATTRTSMFAIVLAAAFLAVRASPVAGEAHWIWSPKGTTSVGVKSQGVCHFRKKFTSLRPETAELEVAAGDDYVIYINGRLAAQGRSNAVTEKYDVKDFMEPGVNLLAIKVRHNSGKQVGLAVRLRVKEVGEPRWRVLRSDESWKTRVNSIEGWKIASYNDIGWLNARTFGPAFVTAKKMASPSPSQKRVAKVQSIPSTTSSSAKTGRTVAAAVPATRQEWKDLSLIESPAKSDLQNAAAAVSRQAAEQAPSNPALLQQLSLIHI